MNKGKLTLLGFIIALIAGLSFVLSQTVLLAQQETPAVPAVAKTAHQKGLHKGKHKNQKKGLKGEKKEKEEAGETAEPKGDK